LAQSPNIDRRSTWRVIALVAILVLACLWVSFQFLDPIPPREIVLASGPASSLHHEHAQRYQEALKRHGVRLVERMTEGAGENLRLLGDKAYDSAELREQLDQRGTKPVIPNRCNRKQPFSFNKRLYKLRWRIENAFNRLKDFRRIATRYDKLARNYLASVCLAAALVWWI